MSPESGITVDFEYLSHGKLVRDVAKVWITDRSFFTAEDDILATLYYNDINYFVIPKRKSRLRKDTYFRFDVTKQTAKEYGAISGPFSVQYHYKGFDFGGTSKKSGGD